MSSCRRFARAVRCGHQSRMQTVLARRFLAAAARRTQARLGYACPAGVLEQRPNFLLPMHAPHWGARRTRQERGQWTPGRSLARNRRTCGALTPSSTGAKRRPQPYQSQLLPAESSRPSLALRSPTLVHCPSLRRRASSSELGEPAAAEPGVPEALAARPLRGRGPLWRLGTRNGPPRAPRIAAQYRMASAPCRPREGTMGATWAPNADKHRAESASPRRRSSLGDEGRLSVYGGIHWRRLPRRTRPQFFGPVATAPATWSAWTNPAKRVRCRAMRSRRVT